MGMNHFLRGKKDSEVGAVATAADSLDDGLVDHRYVRSFNHFLRGRRGVSPNIFRGKKAPGMNHFLRGKKAPGMDHFLRGRKAGLNHFLRGKKSSFNHFLRGKKDLDDGLAFYTDDSGENYDEQDY